QGPPRALSLCGHVVADGEPLVVPDVARDPRFAANPVLKARGIRFYAGAPLRTREGQVLGTLCLLDTQPRTLSPRDVMLLQNMADDVMRAVRQQQNQRYGGVADEGPALALP
ncbi:MAG: GAF domain-containing protein, partial [Ottowia sp.]|nr:GAF domain-containing protein [Ottowia sp.]